MTTEIDNDVTTNAKQQEAIPSEGPASNDKLNEKDHPSEIVETRTREYNKYYLLKYSKSVLIDRSFGAIRYERL